jgi:PAS domain S-box-containing protein
MREFLDQEKYLEPLLDSSPKILRLVLDATPLAVSFWDKDGNVLDCNRRAVELFHCKSREEYCRDFYRYSPECQPDGSLSVEKAKNAIREAYDTGHKSFAWEHVTADGRPLPVEVDLLRVKWKDDHCVIGYARDMLELKEARNDFVWMASVVEASPHCAMYLNENGDIEYVNPASVEISGFTREELLVGGLELIFSPEDVHRIKTEYLPIMKEFKRFKFNMDLIHKNGQKRVLSASIFFSALYGGRIGVGFTAVDITDMDRMYRALENAKKQAEYYNRAKSNFLSRMNHEMRTPMNAIVGMTRIVRTSPNERQRTECLDSIVKSSKHLMGLIDDLLDMSEIDTGDFQLLEQPFSFSSAVQSVIDIITLQASEKGQVFSTEIDKTIPDLLITDERRMKQVLFNLLFNAVKFTPEKGEIRLSAQKTGVEDKKCTIRFEVIDTGIGISAEIRERLWDTFEQADNGISRSYGGAGLGLAIAKRIVEMMNGSIEVESESGKGSRFVCTIRTYYKQTSGSGEKTEAVENTEEMDLTGCRILIVDDVEINRDIILSLLEDTGAVLDCAQGGKEAIDMFTQNGYEMILMDLHMPGMDGFETSRRIRASALPKADSVTIIAVTADTSGDVIASCLEAGMDDHVGKPVDYEMLRKKMARYLFRRPSN